MVSKIASGSLLSSWGALKRIPTSKMREGVKIMMNHSLFPAPLDCPIDATNRRWFLDGTRPDCQNAESEMVRGSVPFSPPFPLLLS